MIGSAMTSFGKRMPRAAIDRVFRDLGALAAEYGDRTASDSM